MEEAKPPKKPKKKRKRSAPRKKTSTGTERVKRIQRAVGIPDDGIFGPQTQEALKDVRNVYCRAVRGTVVLEPGVKLAPGTWTIVPVSALANPRVAELVARGLLVIQEVEPPKKRGRPPKKPELSDPVVEEEPPQYIKVGGELFVKDEEATTEYNSLADTLWDDEY